MDISNINLNTLISQISQISINDKFIKIFLVSFAVLYIIRLIINFFSNPVFILIISLIIAYLYTRNNNNSNYNVMLNSDIITSEENY